MPGPGSTQDPSILEKKDGSDNLNENNNNNTSRKRSRVSFEETSDDAQPKTPSESTDRPVRRFSHVAINVPADLANQNNPSKRKQSLSSDDNILTTHAKIECAIQELKKRGYEAIYEIALPTVIDRQTFLNSQEFAYLKEELKSKFPELDDKSVAQLVEDQKIILREELKALLPEKIDFAQLNKEIKMQLENITKNKVPEKTADYFIGHLTADEKIHIPTGAYDLKSTQVWDAFTLAMEIVFRKKVANDNYALFGLKLRLIDAYKSSQEIAEYCRHCHLRPFNLGKSSHLGRPTDNSIMYAAILVQKPDSVNHGTKYALQMRFLTGVRNGHPALLLRNERSEGGDPFRYLITAGEFFTEKVGKDFIEEIDGKEKSGTHKLEHYYGIGVNGRTGGAFKGLEKKYEQNYLLINNLVSDAVFSQISLKFPGEHLFIPFSREMDSTVQIRREIVKEVQKSVASEQVQAAQNVDNNNNNNNKKQIELPPTSPTLEKSPNLDGPGLLVRGRRMSDEERKKALKLFEGYVPPKFEDVVPTVHKKSDKDLAPKRDDNEEIKKARRGGMTWNPKTFQPHHPLESTYGQDKPLPDEGKQETQMVDDEPQSEDIVPPRSPPKHN